MIIISFVGKFVSFTHAGVELDRGGDMVEVSVRLG